MPLLLAQADESGGLLSVSAFFSFVAAHWDFCVLHFLEFAIWGAWFVVLGNVLNARGFSRKEIGRAYATMPIGSMISPLIIGGLADTLVNTEVLIGVSHLVGGVILFVMARIKNPRPFFWCALLYALAYAPTLSLVNAIVYAHNQDIFGGLADLRFPWIRVFGTLGWIAAGLSHMVLLKRGQPINERPLLLACGLSFILGVYAFTLPETRPPEAKDNNGPAAADALPVTEVGAESAAETDAEPAENPETADELADESGIGRIVRGCWQMLSSNAVFFAVTFIAAMAMGLYFAFAALFLEKRGVSPNVVGPVMTIGQWIEVFFILTLPWFLENWTLNPVLLIGVAAWALRFGLFAIGRPLALVVLGIALHGICFDFFFVAGFNKTNDIAPEGLTATAQTLYGFLVYGLGMYLGSELSGWFNQKLSRTEVVAEGQPETVTRWSVFWGVPFIIVAIAAVLFWLTR